MRTNLIRNRRGLARPLSPIATLFLLTIVSCNGGYPSIELNTSPLTREKPPQVFQPNPLLLPTGAVCTSHAQCGTGKCIDGFCCPTECNQTCYRCYRGSCVPAALGEDPHNDCPQDPKSSCGYDGTCDGLGACRYWSAKTLCREQSCSGDDQVRRAAFCSGNGSCPVQQVDACETGQCNASKTACVGDLPDLVVTHIERLPRYNMTKWCYDAGYSGDTNPHLCYPWQQKEKQQPQFGDAVYFLAHVINKGRLRTNLPYEWKIDGKVVRSGLELNLVPGEERILRLDYTWPLTPGTITFVADPHNKVTEVSELNNSVSDDMRGLALYVIFSKEHFQELSKVVNPKGSRSAEDWFRFQLAALHQTFADSTSDVAPQGVLQKIRLDRIEVVDNADTCAYFTTNRPLGTEFWTVDMRWIFAKWPCSTPPSEVRQDAINYANQYKTQIDHGLLHELGHQMGLIDLYRAIIPPENNEIVPIGFATRWYRDLMGGFMELRLSDIHALYMNTELNNRRGPFGIFLYQRPESNRLLIRDVRGNPLKNAKLTFYQSALIQGKTVFSNDPGYNRMFLGLTDDKGTYRFTDLPFGDEINNWGSNALMIVKIAHKNQVDYQLIELFDFNIAKLQGIGDFTLEIDAKIVDRLPDPENMARLKPVTVSSQRPGYDATFITDGDTTSNNAWSPVNGAGAWVVIDLGRQRDLYKVSVWCRNENHHDMFQQFQIQVSPTGQFNGEQTTVASELDWDDTRYPQNRPLHYVFAPTTGRYVRILAADSGQPPVYVEEIEVFGLRVLSQKQL